MWTKCKGSGLTPLYFSPSVEACPWFSVRMSAPFRGVNGTVAAVRGSRPWEKQLRAGGTTIHTVSSCNEHRSIVQQGCSMITTRII